MNYQNMAELLVLRDCNSERSHLSLWRFLNSHWHPLIQFDFCLELHEVSQMEESIRKHIHESETCAEPDYLFREVSHNHVYRITHIRNFVPYMCLNFIYFAKAIKLCLLFWLSCLSELRSKIESDDKPLLTQVGAFLAFAFSDRVKNNNQLF